MNESLQSAVEDLARQRRALLDDLRAEPAGLAWCERHSDLADRAVQALYAEVCRSFEVPPALAIIATGGFGRRELCPYSDIDITVVPEDESAKNVDAFVRKLYQGLHSVFETSLRLHVGYEYRLISDAPGLDDKSRTALLDSRLLQGSRSVAKRLSDNLYRHLLAGEFIIGKITERERAFEKFNSTPLAVEPNLKEGAGGLRCFHSANWIREVLGERPIKTTPAYDKVISIRNLLHLVAGKHLDHFSRQRQQEVAEILGRDSFSLQGELASAAIELHSEYLRIIEKLSESRFELSRGVQAMRGEARIAPNVDAGEAAIGIANATRLGLRIEESPTVATKGISGPAALYAISQGEPTLRNLDRCGLLGVMLPELTACRTVAPRDPAHDFTVFEHSLQAVRNLFAIDPVSPIGQIRARVGDLGVITLACLLHDVGKPVDEPDHAAIGSKITADVCERWGLGEDISSLATWLVNEHLSMARTIHLRDVMNPATVEEFVELVCDQERLDLLTLLTYADISAVSKTSWTPALESFLLRLHARSSARLESDEADAEATESYRRRLRKQLKGHDVDESEVESFIDSLPANYLTGTNPDTMRLQLQLASRAKQGEPCVHVAPQTELSATDVTISALDRPGLLSQVLGVFYALDLSLVALRASTTDTAPAVALDVFTVSYGGRPVPSATSRALVRELEQVLNGRPVDELMRERGKDPVARQRIFEYHYIEGNPGILEVHAPRGRGMAFRFTRLLAAHSWNVHAARVAQWAGSAAAAFYVTNADNVALSKAEIDAALANLA